MSGADDGTGGGGRFTMRIVEADGGFVGEFLTASGTCMRSKACTTLEEARIEMAKAREALRTIGVEFDGAGVLS